MINNMIKENVQDIGKLNYLLAILTGKNKKIRRIEGKNEEEIVGDFIITLAKKAVILTKYQNGRREPVIVKKWKEIKGNSNIFFTIKPNFKTKEFLDSDGLKWEYNFPALTRDEWIMVYEKNGEELYNISLYK